MKIKILKKVLGWNARSWSSTLFRAINQNNISTSNILEIGAGHLSAISLLFYKEAEKINISYYPDQYNKDRLYILENTIKEIKNLDECTAKVLLSDMSIYEISGTYDLIIMKSVLGGIFRGEKEEKKAEPLIMKLISKNLNKNGSLITIDNGETIFEKYIKNFGARRGNWKMFKKSDFPLAKKQYVFGFFSIFSFTTRIGLIGQYLDDLLYFFYTIIFKIFKIKNPSIILSYYKKD